MILRRAADLMVSDNVRLDDRLWNIEKLVWVEGRLTLHLSRKAGDKTELELWSDDMVLLAI
jgi:hypothetical protein